MIFDLIEKWWAGCVRSILWLFGRFQSAKPTPPTPPVVAPVDLEKGRELEQATRTRDASVARLREGQALSEAEQGKALRESAPDTLSDGDKLNEYLKGTGREVRK